MLMNADEGNYAPATTTENNTTITTNATNINTTNNNNNSDDMTHLITQRNTDKSPLCPGAIIEDSHQSETILRPGCKRNLPMCDSDPDQWKEDPVIVNTSENVDSVDMNDMRSDCLNYMTQRQFYGDQTLTHHQSVLHRSLAECLKRLCKQMERDCMPNTSSVMPSQALDLSMSSTMKSTENFPLNQTLEARRMSLKNLSASPSSSSTTSLASISPLTSTGSNNISQTCVNISDSLGRNLPLCHQYEHIRSDNTGSNLPCITSKTDTLHNLPLVMSQMNSLIPQNANNNNMFTCKNSNSAALNHMQSHDILTSSTLLFPGLSSNQFNLPTLTPTATTISKPQSLPETDIFTKISDAFYSQRNGIDVGGDGGAYDHQSMMNSVLNPTDLIWNYSTNYALHCPPNNLNQNTLNESKKEDTSTCTSPESASKDFDSETSLKHDSMDTEHVESKANGLWLTDADLHSLPNLVEAIKKFHSNDECGYEACRASRLREHYHCGVCSKILLRREEMIRHAKWHRKREESMQYGFMRYSPCDDCTIAACPHNGRQTHYHCMQANCDKVYISTSDVQMHANYHRKDAVIIQEGFQRFRATENCGISSCPYSKEHTTHFHCRRNNCHFTFKNKADMEKHKLHHQKNDRYAQDGFRRYIKCENCDFPDCQYSGVINHIHCIRPGCDYVIHSSSQILSHKRKHDKRFTSFSPRHLSTVCRDDLSQTFSSLNQDQETDSDGMTMTPTTATVRNVSGGGNDADCNSSITSPVIDTPEINGTSKYSLENTKKFTETCEIPVLQHNNSNIEFSASKVFHPYDDLDFNMTEPISITNLLSQVSKLVGLCICRRQNYADGSFYDSDGDIKGKCVNKDQENTLIYTKIDKILKTLHQSYNQHSNECFWPGCPSKGGKNDVKLLGDAPKSLCKYWLSHLWEACLSFFAYVECDRPNCPMKSVPNHIHCRFWPKCSFTNPSGYSNFQVLYEHLLLHDEHFTSKLNYPTCIQNESICNVALSTSYNFVNPRRRGRPPKYAKYIHVPHLNPPESLRTTDDYTKDLSYSMFFSQPEGNKPDSVDQYQTNAGIVSDCDQFRHIQLGVKLFLTGEICPDSNCPYFTTRKEHYHCVKPRCYTASDSLDVMNTHRREFHQYTSIEQGFEYFDTSIDCRRPICHNNKVHKHFHCIYPNCDYTFVRASTMQQHAKKHTENLKSNQSASAKHHNVTNLAMRNVLSDDAPSGKMNLPETDSRISNKTAETQPNSHNAAKLDPVVALLPLGLNPENFPVILPSDQNTAIISNSNNNNNSSADNLKIPPLGNLSQPIECTENGLLPGLLPIWAAAMASAAAATAAITTGSSNLTSKVDYTSMMLNGCMPDIPCISQPFNQSIKLCIPSESHLPVTTRQNSVQV